MSTIKTLLRWAGLLAGTGAFCLGSTTSNLGTFGNGCGAPLVPGTFCGASASAQVMPDRAPTPSEAALQLARRAEAKLAEGDVAAALRLYESAVAADPANLDIRRGFLLVKQQIGGLTVAEKGQLDTLQSIQQTQVDLLLSQLRLTLLNCRLALDTSQFQQAADLAQAGLNMVNAAPKDIELVQYRKAFDKALADARRTGVKPSAHPPAVQVLNDASPAGAAPNAAPIAPLPTDATVAGRGEQVAARWQASMYPDGTPNVGGAPIIDIQAILAADDLRYRFDGDLQTAARQANAWQLTAVDAAMVSPPGLVTYPPDWLQRTAGRQQYADGTVMRGPNFVGADGQTYSTAVYDVSDLYFEAPWFACPYFSSQWEEYQAGQNMQALRWRSQIFGGYASDLAQGMPLLAAFGGVSDQFMPPMPSQRTDQLLTVLQQIVNPQQAPMPQPAPAPAPAPAQQPAPAPANVP